MKYVFGFLLSVVSHVCLAWQLQTDASTVNFVSVKKDAIGEVHRFTQISGSIDDSGNAVLTIPLASVDTGIEIRNQRMRGMLFETEKFPRATFHAAIDPGPVRALQSGEQMTTRVAGQLTLHGVTSPVEAEALVTKLNDGRLSVISRQPFILTADRFALVTGVQKLAQVAGLASISTAVPVTFALTFAPDAGASVPPPPAGLNVQ